MIRLTMVLICLAGIGLVGRASADEEATPSSGAAQSLLDARVVELIELLADDNYHTRENARWELERIGLPAFGMLREAMSHPNIQIAIVARYLVQSQEVTWWLDTDSADVRRLLQDYNALEPVERDARLQNLSLLHSDDAIIALCRLARFESNESLSKSAALYLMESMLSAESKPAEAVARSIALTVENARRPATDWLLCFSNDLAAGQTSQTQWREFTRREALDAVLSGKKTQAARSEQEAAAVEVTLADLDLSQTAPADRARALRFYRWAGNWLNARLDRKQALELASESLALVAASPPACLEFCHWAMDAKMPELVVELASAEDKELFFESYPALGYLRAESYLRLGQDDRAQELAKQASDQVAIEAEKASGFPVARMNDTIAIRRVGLAVYELSIRGMYDWAEQEFERAIELETMPHINADARQKFADFCWAGGKYQQAADVIQPLLDKTNDVQQGLPGSGTNQSELRAYYHFYNGLAAMQAGEEQLATEQFLEAIKLDPNPDVIIAMRQIADEEPMRSYFEQQFAQMADDFRIKVGNYEHTLAESSDRMTRSTVAYSLARACNQLAWLLSKCDSSPEEAVNLSLRSLELNPNDSAYLDTLGRCYFSAGRLKDAVRTQELAVKAAPYDRLMREQLEEFQSVMEAASQHSELP